MRRDVAFAFASSLSLPEQLARLNSRGSYTWIERDGAWYPDYISTRAHPDDGFFKIYDAVDGRFVLGIKHVTDRPTIDAELAKLVRVAREQVLPAIDAREVEATEPYD